MRRACGALVLGLMIAAGLPDGAAAQKKKDKPAASAPATPKEAEALARADNVIGTLVRTGGTDRTLTLRIEYQKLEPREGGGKGAGRNPIHRQQQQILRTTNPLQRALQMQRLLAQIEREQLQALRNQFHVVTEHKDFDLQAAKDATVRFLNPPMEYDDKGYPKKYTPEELKKLKGTNPNLPGYEADFEKLKIGDNVRVTFKKPQLNKDKDKDKDDTPTPEVSMIVILKEGSGSLPGDRPGKSKK
jgi:hypothetical protein